MNIEDIVEGVNRHIESTRKTLNVKTSGHLVFQRIILPHNSFKVYKNCKYIVWFVRDKVTTKVIQIEQCIRILEGKEEECLQELNINFVTKLLNWISSESYKQIIEGNYETT